MSQLTLWPLVEDDQGQDPFFFGPQGHVSFSQISTYSSCPEKYRLRYIDRVPGEPSGPALAGRAGHTAIQLAEEFGWWKAPDLDALNQAFVTELGMLIAEAGESAIRWGGRKSKDFPLGEELNWWCFQGPLMLKRYAAIRRQDSDHGVQVVPDGIERRVATRLRIPRTQREIEVIGFIDAMLMADKDGEPIIRDWKFGSFPGEPHQLAVYSWLLANTPDPLIVTRGQIIKLRSPDKSRWIQEYDLTPWVPLVPKLILDTVRGIEAGVYPLHPSMFCHSCSVRKSCVWGKTLDREPETPAK